MATQVDRVPGTGQVYRQLTLPAQRVWASLSSRNQTEVRQTLVHILQEVLHDQRQF